MGFVPVTSRASYPERSELIAQMCGVWKAARRPPPADHPTSLLDDDGWERLYALARRLSNHLSFEHREHQQLRDALVAAVRQYRSAQPGTPRDGKQLAAEFLDGLAKEPMRRTVYLGIRDLKLPHGTSIGGARFLCPAQDEPLAQSFSRLKDKAPELVCAVDVVAGTDELLRDRSREAAERALALVRQQVLFGFMSKIYLDQVMFGLDGTYTWAVGTDLAEAGWWREPRPMLMDLTSDTAEYWQSQLADLAQDYEMLPIRLRPRVDTCIAWLDVAARSDNWRVIVPAVFSAMEAILVPETSAALKAAVVTVRNVAVHVAVGEGFLDPPFVMIGYKIRSDLVHGTPTSDLPEAEGFAAELRRRGFEVLRDYLKLSKAIGAETINDVIAYLTGGTCEDICNWLEEMGASDIVSEYRSSTP
jgi:hypothetical protein